MKYYGQEIDPIDYLNKCLTTWETFCESHRVLADAIRELLEENKRLSHQNDKITCGNCVKRYTDSCPLFYGEVNGLRFFTRFSKDENFSCKEGVRK